MKNIEIIAKHAESIHHVLEAVAMAHHIEENMVSLIDKCMQLEPFMEKDEFQQLTDNCIQLRSTTIDIRIMTEEALEFAKAWALENMHREFNQKKDED